LFEMGVCGSTLSAEEKDARKKDHHKTRQIDFSLQTHHQADQQVNKLLLLGSGESGKSTLFKQLITLYGPGFLRRIAKLTVKLSSVMSSQTLRHLQLNLLILIGVGKLILPYTLLLSSFLT